MSTLLLVRHGQASFFDADYDHLSDLGRRQARLLGEHWAARGERFDAAITGPLERQRHTAAEVCDVMRAAGLRFPEPEVVPEWDEYPGIQLARVLVPKVAAERPELARMLLDPASSGDPAAVRRGFQTVFEVIVKEWLAGRHDVDGIETWAAFRARIAGALAAVTARHPRGARVVVFSSGGVIGAAVQRVLGLADDKTIELSWIVRNAGFTEILYTGSRMTMVGFNHTPHLAGADLLTYR